ncbi:uncharacterized protein BCR38DRAFT_148791 [Pseudomassariella vexata]|uniref:Uncharacterized protein n=1 Tax=Pseudomassariella vexata TaxID=1141098 RepID=A0A1Y2E6R8_9PEZI|nr:uncharacterized protein BCR38DRAFT_148791 [Pseudomassariella vexata]ORY66976.1 hypothetical protein BCR38DRAFT_148791 [Pseudomassariella vexata]
MQTFEGIWNKRQLVPCWVIQVLCAGIYGIVACLLLVTAGYISRNKDQIDSNYSYLGYSADDLTKYAAATGAVLLVFCIFTVVIDIVECIFYSKRKLNPVFLLVTSSIKTLFWGILLILNFIAAGRGDGSWLGILFGILLVSTSLTQLFISAKFTHRKRKGTFVAGGYKVPGFGGVEAGAGGGPDKVTKE